ncbi:MAG: hypothetical protein HW416_3487 [Chloroflexi bacterium]|nr:hypothetical protein [Chloroflexota bacterium]
MTASNGEREAARLEAAVKTFVERLQPLPTDLARRQPKDGEWSVGQLAAHCSEIYPFWAKQITALRQNPGKPFGRVATDADRIQYVEDHKNDALDTLVAAIQRGATEAAAALRSYSDDEWRTVTGIHSARGEMDMDFIANLFLAGHAEEHVKQLTETLNKIGGLPGLPGL